MGKKNLRNCCNWLVYSFESMMMHGLANHKFEKRRDFSVQNEGGVSFPGLMFAGVLPLSFGT